MPPQPGVETPGYVSGCPVGTNDGLVPAAKILILLPSLALLRQTLHEWLRETRLPSLAYLCVCSDPTVKESIDALATQQSDLDFQVSTDAASVRRFLDAPFAGVKMIFSTYQSASVVGAAIKPGEAFDFAVFDEAHKTAGREGRNFAFALDDQNLPIRKRLFLTATPRHYNPHDRDREGEARLLFSMDNPAVYGPQAYRTNKGGMAWKNPKGISSFSPALARSGYAGWFPQKKFYPNGVLSVGGGRCNPFRVENVMACEPKVARLRNLGLNDSIPLGLRARPAGGQPNCPMRHH
jgi:hypothetical protein